MTLFNSWRKRLTLFCSLLLLIGLITGCQKSGSAPAGKEYAVAVFVPGITGGSPIYEMLVEGTKKAVEESGKATVIVVEGGFNQAEWQQKITSLAATGTYDLIITSNPAMPDICARVAEDFPKQKFAIVDGYLPGHPQIYTLLYNQMEQAYLIGYMGGLVTKSDLPGANGELKVGLIAGQQYPVMDRAIRPGFKRGLEEVDPGIELDFRVLGNWHDAGKAADLAASMYDAGSDVILAIAGGANQGIITVAKQRGKYVLWFDSNGYGLAPGTIIGSTVLKNDRGAYETVKLAIEGKLSYGAAVKVGAEDGFIDFITDDQIYIQNVPAPIREKMANRLQMFKTGALHLSMPDF
jgi:basic membrane lipoprotein Med (substrate-binding protein (PBP1-ABC) superfamily)